MTQTGNAPFLPLKKRGVSYFIATTHDKGEKGEQPFLNEGNLPSAESPLSENGEYCCPVNFKTAEKSGFSDIGSDAATTERPFPLSSVWPLDH